MAATNVDFCQHSAIYSGGITEYSTGATAYDGMTTLLAPTNMQENQVGKGSNRFHAPAAHRRQNRLAHPSSL